MMLVLGRCRGYLSWQVRRSGCHGSHFWAKMGQVDPAAQTTDPGKTNPSIPKGTEKLRRSSEKNHRLNTRRLDRDLYCCFEHRRRLGWPHNDPMDDPMDDQSLHRCFSDTNGPLTMSWNRCGSGMASHLHLCEWNPCPWWKLSGAKSWSFQSLKSTSNCKVHQKHPNWNLGTGTNMNRIGNRQPRILQAIKNPGNTPCIPWNSNYTYGCLIAEPRRWSPTPSTWWWKPLAKCHLDMVGMIVNWTMFQEKNSSKSWPREG